MTRALFALLGLVLAVGHAQQVTTTVNPHNPPIRIPYNGGNFSYTVEAASAESVPVAFQLWTVYRLPGGGEAGPVYGPEPLTLPGGWSAGSAQLIQYLPESMPAGDYRLIARVGAYPDTAWHADSFAFEKTSLVGGWYQQQSAEELAHFDIFFADPRNGWAVGFGIFHTTDGGDNWFEQNDPTSGHRQSVWFTDSLTGWIAGDGVGKMLHTTDGGDTWVIQDVGLTGGYAFDGVCFVDESEGWAAGGISPSINPGWRTIIHTTNGGASWQTQMNQSGYFPFEGLHFADSEHGWVIGAGGIVFSTADGGEHWTEHVVGQLELNGVHFTDSLYGWICGRDGEMFHTTNGGLNWDQQSTGVSTYLADVHFTDRDTGWAVGGDNYVATIIHTTNGGATWFEQDPGTDSLLWAVHFVDTELGWACGWAGVIVHTQDGGGGGMVGQAEPASVPAARLEVARGAPNPFNRRTSIRFSLSKAGPVTVKVYDALGRLVATPLDTELPAGEHSAEFDGRSLPAGTYVVKLEAGGMTATRELVFAR